MAKVLEFIAWVLKQAGRWGMTTVRRVADWARQNWKQVEIWLGRGLSFYTIVEMILRILGIG